MSAVHVVQVASLAAVYAIALCLGAVLSLIPALSPPPGRLARLDGLRGIAAVGVVGCHITQYVVSYSGLTGGTAIGDHWGILGVQVFFAITAFLFTSQLLAGRIAPVPFMVGRIRRILPLYVVVVVVAVVMALYFAEDRGAVDLRELVAVFQYGFWSTSPLELNGFNMLRLIGIAWTLGFEWGFYLLLIPVALLGRWHRGLMWASLVLALGAAAWGFLTTPELIWPFFLPGVVAASIKHYAPPLTPSKGWRAVIVACCAAAAIGGVLLQSFWGPGNLGLVAILFLSVALVDWPALKWPPLLTVGTISYSIYLLQYLVLMPTMHHAAGLTEPAAQLALSFGVAFVVVTLAAISYLLIERPFISVRLLSGLERHTNIELAPANRGVSPSQQNEDGDRGRIESVPVQERAVVSADTGAR